MPSYYSVLQFVPDAIADERVNIGVLVAEDGQPVMMQFLKKWDRVSKFGGVDVTFLRDFAKRLEIQQHETLGLKPWTMDDLKRVSADWTNSLQFTSVRASLKPAKVLLEE